MTGSSELFVLGLGPERAAGARAVIECYLYYVSKLLSPASYFWGPRRVGIICAGRTLNYKYPHEQPSRALLVPGAV
jgi:hypothetical protein